MQIRFFARIFILITIVSMYSCSPKLVSSPPTSVQFSPLSQDFDKLLPKPEIDFSFDIADLVCLEIPKIVVMRKFNKREQNEVRITDDRLFAKRDDLSLNLSKISEEAFTFPLPNAHIISPYGTRRGRNHTGIDLKAGVRDTIYAAFDGIVRVSNRGRGYGNVIVIRHYNGLETVYSHNSKNIVQSGDRVLAGTPISVVGRTGRASTEHLHFEVRINGQHFDPNIIVDFETRQLKNNRVVFKPNEKGKIDINVV